MIQPELLSIPFARDATSGTKNDIPDDPSPALPAQTATWKLGFPAVTMQPLAVGGIPPLGQDFNGVLGAISEHTVFQNSGGVYLFNQPLADAIGGYSKGAVLMDDAKGALYVSLADGNTTNFNTDPTSIGVQWMPIAGVYATETQQGVVKFASGPEVAAGIVGEKAISPSSLLFRTSTETRAGLIRIASKSEAESLESDSVALTPKKIQDAFRLGQSLGASILNQRLPAGVIFKSGLFTNPSGIVNFPTPFPNSCICVLGAESNVETNAYTITFMYSGLTRFKFNPSVRREDGSLSPGPVAIRWFAVGF